MSKVRFVKRSVIALGVTVLLGLALWNVFPGNDGLSHAIISSTPTAGSQELQPAVQSAATPATVAQQYLSIKEWGIDFPLPPEIEGAYYVPSPSSTRGSDGQPNMMWLGIASLDSKGCSVRELASRAPTKAEDKPLGALLRLDSTGKSPVTGISYQETYPNGVTIGNFYYALNDKWSTNSPCTAAGSVGKAMSALRQSVKTGRLSAKNQN